MRRYLNERDKEPFLAFIPKTRDVPIGRLTKGELANIKQELFRKRAIPVRDVLEVINNRKLIQKKQEPTTV